MNVNDPALTFGLALAGGMVAQVIALHMRMPGIVVLLLVGVLLGPDGVNVVRPATLGPGLHMIVAISVAVILFEGGLHLDLHRLRLEALTIRRLVTVGALITAVGGAVAARFVMGWSWQVAILFGTLVIVTGPTVITPLLRRLHIKRNLHTILEAEGVLIDPIGAIIAVVVLEIALGQDLPVAGLLGIPTRLVIGATVGAVGGILIGRLLGTEKAIPHRYASITTLALLLALYACSEALMPESGIVVGPVAGIAVGNMPSRPSRELKAFKEQLTVLLVGLLFVLLAADVRIAEVTGLGWPGLVTTALLMVVVRPIDIAVSTAGSGLSFKERAFLAWLGPRGIVAAAVASLFAQALAAEGVTEGRELQAMVFLVIATTVVIQGLGGGIVARLLGVRQPSNRGYLIAGANALARELARALRTSGQEVVLVETDAAEVAKAEREGLAVLHGNALDDELLERADLGGRRGVIGLIRNEGVGLLVAEKGLRDFRVRTAHIAVRSDGASVPMERVQAIGARLLFGTETDVAHWSRELASGRVVARSYVFTGDSEVRPSELVPANGGFLPLLIEHKGQATPVDDQSRLRSGDLITVLYPVVATEPPSPLLEPAPVPAGTAAAT